MAPKPISISLISQFDPKGFDKAKREAEGLTGEFKSLAKKAAGAFAAVKIAQFGKDAISAASDLGESINAVNVTFGDAAESVLSLSENAATSVGLSERAFNGLAVQLSAFATQITPIGGDVAGTIDDMTTRAADFASVMDISVEEAVGAFQSTLAGSSEVARQYGLDVSAAKVEQYLLNEGLVASKSAITEADKVLGRYRILMQGTEQMAGDFARTSESLANQQRTLNAEFENAQAEIGEKLVPIVADLTGALLDLLDVAEKLGVIEIIGNATEIEENATKLGNSIRGAFDSGAKANYEYSRSVEWATEIIRNFDYELLGTADTYDEIQDVIYEVIDADNTFIDRLHVVNGVFVEQKRRVEEAAEAQQRAYWETRRGSQAFDDLAEDVEGSADEVENFVTVWERELGRIRTERDVEEIAEQFDELRQAQIDAWTAGQEGAEDATEKLDFFEDGLRDAYEDLLIVASELDGLPPEVITEIKQEYETGDLDALETRLNNLALGVIAPVKIKITAETAGISGYLGVSAIKASEAALEKAILSGMDVPQGATGGIVTQPTLALIGERGPEAVVPLNRAPGASPLPNGMDSGGQYNITVNAGVGDPGRIGQEVVAAIQAFERRNGNGWRAA